METAIMNLCRSTKMGYQYGGVSFAGAPIGNAQRNGMTDAHGELPKTNGRRVEEHSESGGGAKTREGISRQQSSGTKQSKSSPEKHRRTRRQHRRARAVAVSRRRHQA